MFVVVFLITFSTFEAVSFKSPSPIITALVWESENLAWLYANVIMELFAAVFYEVSLVALGVNLIGSVRPFSHLLD